MIAPGPRRKTKLGRIVSGGQTGADRAALDFAIKQRIAHGGWCPKGRKAEDGVIPPRYRLTETPGSNYAQRTEWNVTHSDGTVVFTSRERLTGGSKRTAQFARRHKKPLLLVASNHHRDAVDLLRAFLAQHKIRVLNVAGPRASEDPKIRAFVLRVLGKLIA